MPLYSYDCKNCDKQFELRHGYGAKDISCLYCGSLDIQKNLSNVLQVTKKCYNINNKAGNQVKKAIEDGKQELEDFKKKQKNRVYKKK
jgi:putative FmdB family regulatory protein